jgi:serine/threonine protein kinase
MARSPRIPVRVPKAILDYTFYTKRRKVKAYRPKQLLGKGSFADVYLAQSEETKRMVAIKVVPLEYVLKRQGEFNEARVHAAAKHPHIVRFERSFTDGRNLYMLMELCTNSCVRKFLRTNQCTTLTHDNTRTVVWQLLDAVNYLHQHNVVHRDIKPANILLDENFQVKLADFGFATRLKKGEKAVQGCGSLNYMAPELLVAREKRGYGLAVDMWAVGVVMYVLLVGVAPFKSAKREDIVKKIRKGQYTYPDDCKVSSMAKDLIARLLVVDPLKRITAIEASVHPFFMKAHIRTRVHPQSKHKQDSQDVREDSDDTVFSSSESYSSSDWGKTSSPQNDGGDDK